MITDIFHKRYPNAWYFYDDIPREIPVFLRQTAQIIFQDLAPHLPNIEEICDRAYGKLVRELGHGLCDGNSAEEVCVKALCEPYDLWDNTHGSAEQFVEYRFSLLELLMAEGEEAIAAKSPPKRRKVPILPSASQTQTQGEDSAREALRSAVSELNHRFREAGIPFHYHNGIIQRGADAVVESEIHEPFWRVLNDPKWRNVDVDMKEAIDRRDQQGRDAALYALKALESTVKIISDDKGWTKGSERGAANYIDNLVSSSNGRFIEVWESEHLKALFRDLRNPHGHGPGSAPLPTLTEHQQNWTIECAMGWIKSLILRL